MTIRITDGDNISGYFTEYFQPRFSRVVRDVLRYRSPREMSMDWMLGNANITTAQYYRRLRYYQNFLANQNALPRTRLSSIDRAADASRVQRMWGQNVRIQDNIRASERAREASRADLSAIDRAADASRAQRMHEQNIRIQDNIRASRAAREASRFGRGHYIGAQEQRDTRPYPEVPDGWNRRAAIRRQRGAENFEYDMLSDFDRRIRDLTERYGGDRDKAEEKYKSELSKNLPAFFRDSKIFSKMSLKQTVGLIDAIGAFKTTGAAITAGFLALKTTFKTINEFTSAADDANAKLLRLDNLKNFYGGINRNELNAALRAGMSPEEALSAHGNLIAKYGAIENILPVVKQFAGAGRIERMAMANELGLNEKTLAFLEALSGTGRLDREPERDYFARLKLAELGHAHGRSSDASWLSKFSFWVQEKLGATPSSDARTWDIDTKVKDVEDKAIKSSSTPSQPISSAQASYNRNSSYNFSIGNMNVDANNPAEFVAAMQGVAKDKSGYAFAHEFDTGVIA